MKKIIILSAAALIFIVVSVSVIIAALSHNLTKNILYTDSTVIVELDIEKYLDSALSCLEPEINCLKFEDFDFDFPELPDEMFDEMDSTENFKIDLDINIPEIIIDSVEGQKIKINIDKHLSLCLDSLKRNLKKMKIKMDDINKEFMDSLESNMKEMKIIIKGIDRPGWRDSLKAKIKDIKIKIKETNEIDMADLNSRVKNLRILIDETDKYKNMTDEDIRDDLKNKYQDWNLNDEDIKIKRKGDKVRIKIKKTD